MMRWWVVVVDAEQQCTGLGCLASLPSALSPPLSSPLSHQVLDTFHCSARQRRLSIVSASPAYKLSCSSHSSTLTLVHYPFSLSVCPAFPAPLHLDPTTTTTTTTRSLDPLLVFFPLRSPSSLPLHSTAHLNGCRPAGIPLISVSINGCCRSPRRLDRPQSLRTFPPPIAALHCLPHQLLPHSRAAQSLLFSAAHLCLPFMST